MQILKYFQRTYHKLVALWLSSLIQFLSNFAMLNSSNKDRAEQLLRTLARIKTSKIQIERHVNVISNNNYGSMWKKTQLNQPSCYNPSIGCWTGIKYEQFLSSSEHYELSLPSILGIESYLVFTYLKGSWIVEVVVVFKFTLAHKRGSQMGISDVG